MNKRRKYLILISLLYMVLMVLAATMSSCKSETKKRVDKEILKSIQEKPKEIEDTMSSIRISYDSIYERSIEKIKEFEGFSATPYRDVDSVWTIGYGHHVIDNYWRWNDTVTKQWADSLLRDDLNKRINYIDETYNLGKFKSLAIGMFIYNCGKTAYRNSTLRRLVDAREPIDEEILRWCHCELDGETVESKGLKNRRKFELKIYNYGMVQEEQE